MTAPATAAPTPAEVRAEAQERAFWLRTLRDLVTYHGDRLWSESDYATAADVLMLAAQARNVAMSDSPTATAAPPTT